MPLPRQTQKSSKSACCAVGKKSANPEIAEKNGHSSALAKTRASDKSANSRRRARIARPLNAI
jgi:hypothetical protein